MPHLDHVGPGNNNKSSSRLLNALKPRFAAAAAGVGPTALDVAPLPPPPPPPPKDSLNPPPSAFYSKPFFGRSTPSLSPSLSPDSLPSPATPASPPRVNGRTAAASPVPSASGSSFRHYLPSPSVDMDGTDSSGSCPNPIYNLDSANASSSAVAAKPKKSVFKFASLARRNRSRKDLSDAASASGSDSRTASLADSLRPPDKEDGDEGISTPWNFQHNIHVDEGYIGLPPSWSDALHQIGFTDDEIAAIHTRRRAAATGLTSSPTLSNILLPLPPPSDRPPSPLPPPSSSLSASSSATLLNPAPRSTSLRKGRDALAVHPTSIYSVATTTTPAPSPSAPSFSIKSFVTGIKHSLTSDSASTTETVPGSTTERETREGSDQYVLVDGDGPEESTDQRMPDETLIEPYPLDTSSVSSRSRPLSQDQHTPRTPTFPQIHVQRAHSDSGHVPFPSPRAPSPLSLSATLPIPTTPRRRDSNNSSSLRPSPVSAPPRTPPRRIYHVVNASTDSGQGVSYDEPPPAYVSPAKNDWVPNEKVGFPPPGPPPSRPVPPAPVEDNVGEPSTIEDDQQLSIFVTEQSGSTSGTSLVDIPGTADDVLDISSYYTDNSIHEADPEVQPDHHPDAMSPTQPLVIDKRLSKLATLPPRISFHQEDSLEDWSESLFSVIGKRSSIRMKRESVRTASTKGHRRTTIRPISPLPMVGGTEDASTAPSGSLPTEPVASSLPEMSFGADLTLGSRMDIVEEDYERGQAEKGSEETKETSEHGSGEQAVDVEPSTTETRGEGSPSPPLTPLFPELSLDPNLSSGKDLGPLALSESSPRASVDTIPPPPPPKPRPKSKPAPLALPPPPVTLAPPKMNLITGISGRSPVSSLFGVRPHPLPIPISPSQIRAQLRPAPHKPPYPPPTLPLPPLRRIPPQPNAKPPPDTQLPPVPLLPSPQTTPKHASTAFALQTPPPDSRPNSSQTLHPVDNSSGDRNSGLSTITVTSATIATAEVIRTAVASVVDSDTVSLTSRRESTLVTAETELEPVAHGEPDIGRSTPSTVQEHGEAPDDSLISETSSVSLLHDGPRSKWPSPPPPPVELEVDSTPRRISRFRTTSLGRVTHLQSIGSSAVSPVNSHSSHGSSDTTSSSTGESSILTTTKGMDRVAPKTKGSLAPETRLLTSRTDTFGGVDIGKEEEFEAPSQPLETAPSESQASTPPTAHPLLTHLRPYITPCTPASCFTNLVEIAEGESGSVYAARVVSPSVESRSQGESACDERPIPPGASHVAIKRIILPPLSFSPSSSDDSPVSNKLISVAHELELLKNLDHEHLLLLDAVYVEKSSRPEGAESASTVDTSLWIRMELMERSLADVIGLVAEGLALQERMVGRFASDILHGLDYLQKQHIAHRDVRSDNVLVSAGGIVKLADFSNAIRIEENTNTVTGAVGVIYWQAPEMRVGPYNPLKVDVWSLGATVWELAETVPPFSMPASPSAQVTFQTANHVGSQWPPLTHPEHYSRTFHEFLKLCSKDPATRPSPAELLDTQFIHNACGRPVILQLLSQCRAIEETMVEQDASGDRS